MTPSVSDISARGSLGTVASWAVLAVLVVVLAPLRSHMPSGHLDSSWGAVLWHARDHELQHGTEIVFTYGEEPSATRPLVHRPAAARWPRSAHQVHVAARERYPLVAASTPGMRSGNDG